MTAAEGVDVIEPTFTARTKQGLGETIPAYSTHTDAMAAQQGVTKCIVYHVETSIHLYIPGTNNRFDATELHIRRCYGSYLPRPQISGAILN